MPKGQNSVETVVETATTNKPELVTKMITGNIAMVSKLKGTSVTTGKERTGYAIDLSEFDDINNIIGTVFISAKQAERPVQFAHTNADDNTEVEEGSELVLKEGMVITAKCAVHKAGEPVLDEKGLQVLDANKQPMKYRVGGLSCMRYVQTSEDTLKNMLRFRR